MNPEFLKTLNIPILNEKKEFIFMMDDSAVDPTYRISVIDERNEKISTSPTQDQGGMWTLVGDKLPYWLIDIELELGYAIDDSHKEHDDDLFLRN